VSSSSLKRQVADWIKQARRAGWTVEKGGPRAQHWKWWRPDGSFGAVTPSTPGGTRARENMRAKLRRAGLDVQ
jgi:hypothetical protein